MLYRTLMRMIERGQIADIESKLDIFFAANKLSKEEYTRLMNALQVD